MVGYTREIINLVILLLIPYLLNMGFIKFLEIIILLAIIIMVCLFLI